MDVAWVILIALVALAGGAAVALLVSRRPGQSAAGAAKDAGEAAMRLLLEQVNELGRTVEAKLGEFSRTVDSKLSESHRSVSESLHRQMSDSREVIRDVTERLAKLDETNRQVVGFADQLQDLQNILKNPKNRGVLGEYYLETLLKNVLPTGSYQMQYPFKNGDIVDAVVFVKERVIPIDSKFSLENYNKLAEERDPVEREKLERVFKSDLKNRIDETAKYVRPEEGTMEFAFMFIPHEAIYYDLLVAQVGAVKVNTRDLVEYAFKEKKVIITSPTSFLAYLQTVLQGLKALQIEESAKIIRQRVEELGRHLAAYDQYMKALGKTLGTAVSHYNKADQELLKIDKDVLRITGTAAGVESLKLEKPADAAGAGEA
jgi:DNA recombination protein RmuC